MFTDDELFETTWQRLTHYKRTISPTAVFEIFCKKIRSTNRSDYKSQPSDVVDRSFPSKENIVRHLRGYGYKTWTRFVPFVDLTCPSYRGTRNEQLATRYRVGLGISFPPRGADLTSSFYFVPVRSTSRSTRSCTSTSITSNSSISSRRS